MARAQTSFVMDRGQVSTIIEALGMSEAWLVHMQDICRQHWEVYEKLWKEQFQLELKLRNMLNDHINTELERG